MAIVYASTSDFTKKVAALKGGDTLILSPGNYGDFSLSNKTFASNVTIKGGTFNSINLYNDSHMVFSGIKVNFTPNATTTNNSFGFRIANSDNITVTASQIKGGPAVNGVDPSATTLDSTGNVLGLPAGKAFIINSSDHITVKGNDISMFAKGITFNDVSAFAIKDNTIHDLRTTPIDGMVTSNVTITGNHTWNSNPWNYGGDGDHGDMLHIWTGTKAINNLTIANNVFEQGTGAPMMGVYLDDNGKGLGFNNTLVYGNTITNSHAGGLVLENVSGVVQNNTLSWAGTGDAYHNTPRIQVAAGSDKLDFISNTGELWINPTVHDINIVNEIGDIRLRPGVTDAAKATIHVAVGDLNSAIAKIGLDPVVSTLDTSLQAATQQQTSSQSSFVGSMPTVGAVGSSSVGSGATSSVATLDAMATTAIGGTVSTITLAGHDLLGNLVSVTVHPILHFA